MYLGYLVEVGTRDEIFKSPVHPYTKALLSAIPSPDPLYERNRDILSYSGDASIYATGTVQKLSNTHSVLATEEQLRSWLED